MALTPAGLLLVGLLMASWSAQGFACKVTGWEAMDLQSRLFQTDIVVVGYDMRHIHVNESGQMPRRDMEFMVECVLKDDGEPVEELIIVEMIWPLTSCQANMKPEVGDRLIQGLQRTSSGNYRWHEINVMQESMWSFKAETLDTALSVCGMSPTLPSGVDPDMGSHCPEVTIAEEDCVKVGAIRGGSSATRARRSVLLAVAILFGWLLVR